MEENTMNQEQTGLGLYCLQNQCMGPNMRKPVFGDLRTTKGTDQPALPRSLIRVFVTRLLESITSKL